MEPPRASSDPVNKESADAPPHPQTSTRTRGPAALKLALLTWVASYPVITVILGLLGPELATWPLGLRTLVVSVLMVATLTWLMMPALTRLVRPWLRPA